VIALLACVPVLCAAEMPGQSSKRDLARQILEASGVRGGLIVHLSCGGGKLTAALRASDSYLVHGLDTDAEAVQEARQHIQSLGLYGNVSVAAFDGQRLPYIDNLVNLVVVSGFSVQVLGDELARVLAPGGVVMVRGDLGDTETRNLKP